MVEFTSAESRSAPPRAFRELSRQRRQSSARSKSALPAAVFAITSGKGGVGKTSATANLATALTRMGKRVMAIDADLGLANLDLFLGVKPTHTLADFFSGAVPLEDILISTPEGILLLPGASGIQEITALRHEQKAALLTELDAITAAMDLVLVDTGSGISDAVTYFTAAAHEIIILVTPEPSSMTDAYAVVKVLASAHGQKRFRILANNVAGEEEARRLFDTLSRTALRFLNASLDLLGWIPRDSQLARSVARAQTVVTHAPESPSARAFTALAQQLSRMTAAEMKVKGNLQFFFRRLLERRRSS